MKTLLSLTFLLIICTSTLASDEKQEQLSKIEIKQDSEVCNPPGNTIHSSQSNFLVLPEELIIKIIFHSNEQVFSALILTSKQMGLLVGKMKVQLMAEYWNNVDGLLACETVFDFSKKHFTFFRHVKNNFPSLFNKLNGQGLTALHKTVLAKNKTASAFLMCHDVRRDILAVISEENSQGNSVSSTRCVKDLIGTNLQNIFDGHFSSLVHHNNIKDRFPIVSKDHLGKYLVRHGTDLCQDPIKLLDFAINYPNAQTPRNGQTTYDKNYRILLDCLQDGKFEEFNLLIKAGANFDYDRQRFRDYRFLEQQKYVLSRGLLTISGTHYLIAQPLAVYASKNGLVSQSVLEEFIFCAAGCRMPCLKGIDESAITELKNCISSNYNPNGTWSINNITTDLEDLATFLKSNCPININRVFFKYHNALSTAIDSLSYGSQEFITKTIKKIELLLLAGANPYHQFSNTWYVYDKDIGYIHISSPPIIRFLTAHGIEFAIQKYLDLTIQMLRKSPDKTILNWLVHESTDMAWYLSPEIRSVLISEGIDMDPLAKDEQGRSILRSALKRLNVYESWTSSSSSSEEGDFIETSCSCSSSSEEEGSIETSCSCSEGESLLDDLAPVFECILADCYDRLTPEDLDLSEFENIAPDIREYLKGKGFHF